MTVRRAAAGLAIRAVIGSVTAASAAMAGASCGAPRAPAPTPHVEPGSATGTGTGTAQTSAAPAAGGPRDATAGRQPGMDPPDPSPVDAKISAPSANERLAAIEKAVNDLREAAQQCWAAAATERFDIEGEITLQIEIAAGGARAAAIQDTARNARLAACMVKVVAAYRWAPPLYGETIRVPFKFRAPDGQNTIDRALVAWNGQGKGRSLVSVAVLLDENNTGGDAASMFELAIAAGGTTGQRRTDRAELWYFLGAGQVASPAGGRHAVAAGDMMYVPRGAVREVTATADLHAMIAMVPGGREGAARGGALPTPEVNEAGGSGGGSSSRPPRILPAAAARNQGPEAIYADAAAIPDRTLSASILAIPAGTKVAEHVHAGETVLLYLLAGSGTLTVNGFDLPVTPTSVVQIPKNTRHAFVATTDVRAVLITTPAGPEQGTKAHP